MDAFPTGAGSWKRHWPLWAGGLILAGLWLGPLPAMSRADFSLHMALHLGVVVVAAPLLGIGLARAGLGRGAGKHLLFWAVAASLFEMLVVWGWHTPSLHEAASRQTPMFILQQLTFLAAGICIWLVSFSGRSRSGAGIGAVALMMTFMHMTMLGVLLALVPDLLYAPDLYGGIAVAEKIRDQSMGGILMAIGGSFPYLFGGLVLGYRLIADQERITDPYSGAGVEHQRRNSDPDGRHEENYRIEPADVSEKPGP